VLEGLTRLDRVLYGEVDWRDLSAEAQDELRLQAVAESVAYHRARNPRYAAFCERRGFRGDELGGIDDLAAVPQLPVTAFKRADIVTDSGEPVAKRCTSSGTLGGVSVVLRDRTTIDRLLGSVISGIRLLGDWTEHERRVVNLGPPAEAAGDLWFAYVMGLLELIAPTDHVVEDGVLRLEEAVAALVDACREGQCFLVGPPLLVRRLAEHHLERGRRVPGRPPIVVTAGGWKRQTGERIDREDLDRLAMSAFGIPNRGGVRDAFNMVELNTVLFECAGRRKHAPPWLHVIVRGLRDLAPVPAGEPGLLSFLDPTAQSYPCFIVADDVGLVRRDRCSCGLPGTTVEIHRRLERVEARGCALKMEAFDVGDGR
jgi:long-chain-fatty-acid---luciferin-component ligase